MIRAGSTGGASVGVDDGGAVVGGTFSLLVLAVDKFWFDEFPLDESSGGFVVRAITTISVGCG